MIRVKFFASLRESLECEQLELSPDNLTSVQDIQNQLIAKGEQWQKAFAKGNLLVAVNQSMANPDATVSDGDEVAFFPPVTGG